VPEGSDRLTIRCTLRWVAEGHVDWHAPRVECIAAPRRPGQDVTIAVVTGCHGGRPKVTGVQDNVEFYSGLCEAVCRENDVDLIALPEIALTWNEGDQDWVVATVNLQDGYRYWNGGCFRDVNWAQRRPHLYAEYTDPSNYGSLR